MKLAVICAAYQAERYIGEMVASFYAQEPLEGWEYELRVGVDGCPATSAALSVPHWYSDENVGAYVMRNSLIGLAPADAYWIFDADDVMLPDLLKRHLPMLADGDIVTASRWECNENLDKLQRRLSRKGRFLVSRAAWQAAGGFRPERVSSDTDFQQRAEALGFQTVVGPFPPSVLRRTHANQLTKAGDTRIGGPERASIVRGFDEKRRNGELRIEPQTTTLRRVSSASCDAVIVFRKDGGNELPHTIHGLRRFAKGLRDIYVIGDDPGLPGVTHIPCGDPNQHNVEANMIRKALVACGDGRISDPFLLCANDEIFLAPVNLLDYPLYWCERRDGTGDYSKRVANTREACEAAGLPYRFYDGHIPVLVHKSVYEEAMRLMPWDTDEGPGILCRTPYGCLLAQRGARQEHAVDPKKASRGAQDVPPGLFCISTRGTVPKGLRAILEGVVVTPAPFRSNLVSRAEKLQRLGLTADAAKK